MLREEFNQHFFSFIEDINKITFEMTNDHRPKEVTPLHYNMLENLYGNEGQTLSELCTQVNITISNGSRELKKMIEKELIIKVKNLEDKRKSKLYLTRSGKILLDECFFQIIKNINRKNEKLKDDEISNLIECMNYITKKIL